MNKPEMPRVLKALCMLSFLGSGGGFLLYLAAAIFYEKTEQIVLEYSSMHSTEQIPAVYFLLYSVMFGISLFGVIWMWKLRKAGFYFYLTAQLAILLFPLLWIGKEAFSAVALIFTVVFLVAYSTQYGKLSKKSVK